MEQHVKIVAILNIVLGSIGIMAALIVLLVFGGLAGVVTLDQPPDSAAAAVFGLIGGIAFIFVAVFSVPSLIAGIGLLNYSGWARTLTIVMSIVHLVNIPIGTIVGIYGLWVLFNEETTALLNARSGMNKGAMYRPVPR